MFGKKLKKCSTAMVLILIMTFVSATVLASTAAGQNQNMLDAGQTVNGPGFFSGNLVQVNGTVDGTTFAFGQEVRINGTINGDLIVAAQEVYINGDINGNVYSAGQNLTIGTKNTGDVFLAGQRIDITKDAVIGRDLFAGGAVILQQGTVKRQFSAGGSDISISGSVGKDADLEAENINLLDGAVINGNLSYKSANKANIYSDSKINGKTYWEAVVPDANQQKSTLVSSFGNILWSIAGALLIWFLIKIWRPDFWAKNAGAVGEYTLKAIGIGILAFIVTPITVILLMITVIGVPLGIILALVYGITLYISKIIVAVFIGAWLTKRFGWTERHKGVWPVLLGLTIIVLLTKVPIAGFLIWFLTVFAGFGSLILSNYKVPVKS